MKTAVIHPCKPGDKDDRPADQQKVCLYTSDGSKLLGRHPSKEKAEAQERAIQVNKHASLRSKTIRLAFAKPELRKHLLPILRKASERPKLVPLTPSKVTADIKKTTALLAGKYRPRLGEIHAGFQAKKINSYYVTVTWQGTGGTEEARVEAWDRILQGLIDAGYLLVANVLGDPIYGGPEALKVGKQNGIIAVVSPA